MAYTPINNNFFKSYLPKLELTGSEFRVLMLIFWRTTCFNEKFHEIAIDFIVQGTGLSRKQVKRVIKSLCDKKLIRIKTPGIGTHPQIIEISGVIDGHRWGHKCPPRGVTDGQKVDNHDPQESKEEIKDKENKEKKEAPLPFPSFYEGMDPDDMTDEQYELWQEWRVKYGLI